MQSTDETPSRFEKARAEALMVDASRTTTKWSSSRPARTPKSNSPPPARRPHCDAPSNLAVPGYGTRLNEGLKLAETLIQNQQRTEVHLFSDGAVPA